MPPPVVMRNANSPEGEDAQRFLQVQLPGSALSWQPDSSRGPFI